MPLQTIRNSERKDFLRCPQRWDWAWNQGLRSRKGGKLHFWFGTGVHLALALWYIEGKVRGIDPRETWRDYCERERCNLVSEIADDEEAFQEVVDLGVRMFMGYLEKYGDDKHMQVVAPERAFRVKITRPDGQKMWVVGTWDLVYFDLRTGKLWLGEHKTAKIIRVGHLPTDNQGGLYFSVATAVCRHEGIIGPKDELMGINYNFLRKAAPDPNAVFNEAGMLLKSPEKKHYAAALVDLPEFEDLSVEKIVSRNSKDVLAGMAAKHNLRVVGDVAADQPASFFRREEVRRTRRERKQIIERVGQEAMWMEEARSGRLPLLKNYTTDCEWDCDFYHLCQLHEKGDDWQGFRAAVFNVTDPYSDHRKSA